MASQDQQRLDELFATNRSRLRKMVVLRLDRRIQGRVDPSDVIQEAFVEATQRYPKFLADQSCSEFVWLRYIALQKVAQLHRKHFGVQSRTVANEVHQHCDNLAVSSCLLAEQLSQGQQSPLSAIVSEEEKANLLEAIESLKQTDREILALRHFEMLTNSESADVLGVSPDTAYRRYIRALDRLRAIMERPQE